MCMRRHRGPLPVRGVLLAPQDRKNGPEGGGVNLHGAQCLCQRSGSRHERHAVGTVPVRNGGLGPTQSCARHPTGRLAQSRRGVRISSLRWIDAACVRPYNISQAVFRRRFTLPFYALAPDPSPPPPFLFSLLGAWSALLMNHRSYSYKWGRGSSKPSQAKLGCL